jgi:hypothetical protein
MRLRIALIAPLVLACGLAVPGVTNPPTSPPTASPDPTSTPTTPPSESPTLTPSDSERPPDGVLSASYAVVGWLGTFCWGSTCVDAGGLPPRSQLPEIFANAGTELTFTLADGTSFYSWSAWYRRDSNDDESTEIASGGDPVDPDSTAPTPVPLTEATFPMPDQEDGVLTVNVTFADGDASYAWRSMIGTP